MERRPLVIVGIVLVVTIAIVGAGACWLGTQALDLARPPTPTPAPPPIVNVQMVRRAAELATVKSTVSTDIVSTSVPDDIRQYLGIKEELVLIAYGEVVAGFDLSELDQDALWVDGTRVQLRLPTAKILYTRLDNERTHVVYRSRSVFVQEDINLEGRARQRAEEAIHQAALDSELLYLAGRYGEMFFANWLYALGFTEVQVVVPE